jgi:hypothetical protein
MRFLTGAFDMILCTAAAAVKECKIQIPSRLLLATHSNNKMFFLLIICIVQ